MFKVSINVYMPTVFSTFLFGRIEKSVIYITSCLTIVDTLLE